MHKYIKLYFSILQILLNSQLIKYLILLNANRCKITIFIIR